MEALAPRQSDGQAQRGPVRGLGEGQRALWSAQSQLAGNLPRISKGGGDWRGLEERAESCSFCDATSVDGTTGRYGRRGELGRKAGSFEDVFTSIFESEDILWRMRGRRTAGVDR